MSTPDPTESADTWGRTLDLFSLLALTIALFGSGMAFREGLAGGLLSLALCLAVVIVGLRIRAGHGTWEPYALVAASIILMTIPGNAVASGFYAIFVIALVALRRGFLEALGASAVHAVSVALWFHLRTAEPLSESALAAFWMLLFFILGVGFGGLLRELESARRLAAHHGAELALANEQLRASIGTERELVLAQERARSARDLHDGLGHRLTLVAMSLDFAQRMRDKEPERAWEEVSAAARTNSLALDEMRVWARALDPPKPAADIGGAAAFEVIADAFRGTGLHVRVSHEGSEDTLPGPIAVFATRLIQEGLTNVLRHATATTVDIDISQNEQQVRVALRDNGAARNPAVHEGFGLRSLRMRAEELGGRLTFGPTLRGGWGIAAVLPLAEGAI